MFDLLVWYLSSCIGAEVMGLNRGGTFYKFTSKLHVSYLVSNMYWPIS